MVLGMGDINAFGGLAGALDSIMYLIGGLLAFICVGGVIGLFLFRRHQRAKFNIPCTIITPRSDGRVTEVNEGIGGFFKSAKVGGITSFKVKRKGIGVAEIPPPDSIYLTAPHRRLFLAQKGMDDYEPILPDSLNKVTIPNGKKVSILELKAKNQDATAWAFDNEESAKRRFTIHSLWDKYQTMITMMMFVFILFLVLYINWLGMKDVVAGLGSVADALDQTARPIITPGAG